jgi:hypothetical protein
MLKVTLEEIEEIHCFIRREEHRLKCNIPCSQHDKVIVSLPSWLLIFIKMAISEALSSHAIFSLDETKPMFFYGCKIQFNYTDEVVVFYEDYYLNRELYKPGIYQINTLKH